MPAGRPRKYDRAAIHAAFEKYVSETEIPIYAEFAANQGFGKQVILDLAEEDDEFSDLVRKCVSKKEAALERKGLMGETNASMTIFSLKQLGWTDRQEQTLKGDADHPITVADVGRKW